MSKARGRQFRLRACESLAAEGQSIYACLRKDIVALHAPPEPRNLSICRARMVPFEQRVGHCRVWQRRCNGYMQGCDVQMPLAVRLRLPPLEP